MWAVGTPCTAQSSSSPHQQSHAEGLSSCPLHSRGRLRSLGLLVPHAPTKHRWRGACIAAYRGQYREGYRGEREPAQRAPLRAPYRQRRPLQRRLPPPPEEPILSSEQVVGKQVITRTTGVNLGMISHLYTDPDLLRIVSANLRPKGLSLGSVSNGNLVWETVCQVGDVVLVHDESALDFAPQDDAVGFIDLMGCSVRTARGEQLGKVREYTFSPDSGRIDLIKFDALGWRSVPEALIGVWQVGVEFVEGVEERDIYLLPQAENALVRVSDGPLEAALLQLQKLFQSAAADDDYADGGVIDAGYQDWLVVHGAEWEASYGVPPPPTRREFDMFMRGTQAGRQGGSPQRQAGPRTVRSLPPGRAASVSERLEPARERILERVGERRPAMRSREAPAPREDPRARRRPAQPDTAYRPEPGYQAPQLDFGYRPAQPPPGFQPAQPSPAYRAAPQVQQPRTVASIPIIERKRTAPQQQDADRGMGNRRQAPAQPSGKPFDDWVDRTPVQQQREPALEGGYEMAPGGAGAWDGAQNTWSRTPDLDSEPAPAWDSRGFGDGGDVSRPAAADRQGLVNGASRQGAPPEPYRPSFEGDRQNPSQSAQTEAPLSASSLPPAARNGWQESLQENSGSRAGNGAAARESSAAGLRQD